MLFSPAAISTAHHAYNVQAENKKDYNSHDVNF